MTNSTSITFLGTEFDAFLFAPVGEEGKGGMLSVVSMLARLDMDPWKEAASLARMPVGAATQRLASLIATLPDLRPDPSAIAARLTALLPQKIGEVPPARILRAVKAVPKSPTDVYILVLALAAIVLLAITIY